MEEKKNKKGIKNYYFLAAPLALVAFALMDVVGGINFPGYKWTKNLLQDLIALNSHSFVISVVFCAFFVLLTLVSVCFIRKFYKKQKFNKSLKKGFIIFLIASIISSVGFLAFMQPESGKISTIKDKTELVMKTDTIEKPVEKSQDESQSNSEDKKDDETSNENANSGSSDNVNLGATKDGSNTNANTANTDSPNLDSSSNASSNESSSESEPETVTEEIEVVDEEAMSNNFNEISEIISSNPIIIGTLACALLSAILFLIAFIFMIIGGFKKGGIFYFAVISIFCLVLLLYGCVAGIVMNVDMFGLNLRFLTYSPIIFLALWGAYTYVTNIEE